MLRKYGTATHIRIPIVKAASANFAVGADWTPAAGDVKISKDGGAAANVTNLPTAIAMGNAAMWDFSLTATEMEAAEVVIIVADSATKAVEDQAIVIETYGHASGEHAYDLDTATQAVTVASGGITAASIATDAIDNDAIAANAVTELQAGLATAAALADVQADTNDIQSRLPAALVSGRMDSSVGAMAAGVVTAAAVATDAIDADALAADVVTEIAAGVTVPSAASVADAVWDEATTGHTTSGTFGEQLKTDVDAILVDTAEIGAAGAGLTALASQASVNTIDDLLDTEVAAIKADTAAILADTGTDGVVVASINANAVNASALAADAVTEIANGVAAPTAASIADAVWDEATAGHTTSGTFGEQAKTDVDAILAAVDTEVASIVTSLSTISGYLDTEVASILAAVDTEVAAIKAKTDNLPAAPAATGDIPTANAVRDAILAGTIDELAAVPAASPTLEQALAFLFMALRNRTTVTSTTATIQNDAGTTIASAAVSDDGTVATKGEYA